MKKQTPLIPVRVRTSALLSSLLLAATWASAQIAPTSSTPEKSADLAREKEDHVTLPPRDGIVLAVVRQGAEIPHMNGANVGEESGSHCEDEGRAGSGDEKNAIHCG